MKNIFLLLTLSLVLSGCKTLERVVYVDQYLPVVVHSVLPECDRPISRVGQLTPEQASNDGAYLQAHAADDVAIRGYAECNAKVIAESNRISTDFNKNQILKVPVEKRPEFIDKLPESIKRSLGQ